MYLTLCMWVTPPLIKYNLVLQTPAGTSVWFTMSLEFWKAPVWLHPPMESNMQSYYDVSHSRILLFLFGKNIDPVHSSSELHHEWICACVCFWRVLNLYFMPLQVIVWGDYGRMDHKCFMGVAQILLEELDLSSVVIGWYKLFPPSSLVDPTLTPLTRRASQSSLESSTGPPCIRS